MSESAAQWRAELAGWAIPDRILEQAPEPPWGFPVELFRAPHPDCVDSAGSGCAGSATSAGGAFAAPVARPTPSQIRASQVLPDGGAVMDVGCGGGSAALALVPPAGLVVGVDSSAEMLAEFDRAATRRGVDHRMVLGTSPEAASKAVSAGPADVVTCHHVLYNVPDLEPFVLGLNAAAGRRVVIELTARHPLVATAALWKHFHGLDRPQGPAADLAVAVIRELGFNCEVERWSRPPRDLPRDALVRVNRRRLCLPVESEPEVERVMGEWGDLYATRDVVTIWWDR
jgi:SAM-dependent methyltransferase